MKRNHKYSITVTTPIRKLRIANRWEDLTPKEFQKVVSLLSLHASGMATPEDVKFLYVCHQLGIDKPSVIRKSDAASNLIIIAEKVNFIFDKNGNPTVIYAAQLIPKIKRRKGYQISTEFDTLTTSLTAQQFIDAHDVIKAGGKNLPLLASILYFNGRYNSDEAHRQASYFRDVSPIVLQAMAVNFQAFVSFLFKLTHFSILSQNNKTENSEITTGLSETLYNLCADGLGNIDEMKQLPIIEFLSILRKKLIEAVRAMHEAEMDMATIVDKTGLHSKTIKKII